MSRVHLVLLVCLGGAGFEVARALRGFDAQGILGVREGAAFVVLVMTLLVGIGECRAV